MDIVGIPMGNNCAPLVADLFLFCYERDFILFLSDNSQADTIVVMGATMAQIFFKPEKNLEFFRLKNLCHR